MISVITSLRGLAAILVFSFHLVCVSNNYISSDILHSIFKYGKHGVDLFFVISGFVICYSMIVKEYHIRHFFSFFKKRLIRIEPPYLATLLICIFMILIRNYFQSSNQESTPIDVNQVLLHLGYFIPFSQYEWFNIVFWTLANEFQFYLLIALTLPYFFDSKTIRPLVYISSITLSYYNHNESFILYWLPVFMTGINLALFFAKKTNKNEFYLIFIILNIFILYNHGIAVLGFTLFPQIIIYYLPYYKNKFFTFFGEISYTLYLTHTIVAFTIINIGFKLPQTLPVKVLVVMFAIFATIIFSVIFNKFIEKPFQKIVSKINYK